MTGTKGEKKREKKIINITYLEYFKIFEAGHSYPQSHSNKVNKKVY